MHTCFAFISEASAAYLDLWQVFEAQGHSTPQAIDEEFVGANSLDQTPTWSRGKDICWWSVLDSILVILDLDFKLLQNWT